MEKGNYTALQQLKPTEIKVGELYNKWVDGYVKNGEAERAAKAKMLADQKKSAQEMVAKIDPKIFTTLQSFQPQTNEIFNNILENKAILGRMVDSGQMDSNFYNLKAKTDNLASQYLQLSTIVTNPQFLEADKKINDQIQEGDVFEGDENMGRWMSIKSGMAQLKANPNTGNIEVIYQNNIKSEDPNKPAKVEQLHEFASKYSSGVSKNLKSDIEEKLKAVSAEASKKINSDGITTYDSKAFNEVTARNTITQLMGLDPNKPVEEQFTNVNNLTPFAKQYFYGNGRLRFPENGEDLKVLVDDAVNFAKGYSNTSYGQVTSQSAADREGQYWDNKNKKKQFYKQDAPSGGSGSSEDGFVYGNTMLRVPAAKGNVGYYQQNAISLKGTVRTAAGKTAQGDDIPASTKDVFVTAYWNPNGGKKGNGSVAYGVSLPSAKGGMTTKPLASKQDPTGLSRAQQYLSNTDYVKLLKAASLIQNNTKLQRSGTFVEDVDMTYRNVDFNTLNK